MDLIYTNPQKEDVGVIHDYSFDLAFGSDENNFECEIQASAHCCEPGAFLYIEGTEYGGIVDSINVNTETRTVTYKGRTWHGILSGKVIQPPKGYDEYVVSGDANRIIQELLSYLGLDGVFAASAEASEVVVGQYAFRYTDAYSGLCNMAAEYGGKLKMEFKTDTVILSIVYFRDFSQNEEWDSSQVDFDAQKNYKVLNHLVCLGSGNMKDRHVIHLFADEHGGVQPYALTEYPVSDADYILDSSGQQLFGVDEITDTYDYPNAQTVENFIALTEQPSDWTDNYGSYFRLDEENEYIAVEGTPVKVYAALTEQPSDWSKMYANYFIKSGTKYKAVEGAAGQEYTLQTAKPADWDKNYGNYYYRSGSEYLPVESEGYILYKVMTTKPVGWEEETDLYYKLQENGGFLPAQIGDEWVEGRYATGLEKKKAPKWEADKYYTGRKAITAPAWTSGMYYSLQDAIAKPSFASGIFFAKVYDHYAELVKGGLKRLQSAFGVDTVKIDLNLDEEYDIGDIVGAAEHITGISVWQPITKKIVNIKNGRVTISYKVGD